MFASKEEALAIIETRFPSPEYETRTHRLVNGLHMMQVNRIDDTPVTSFDERTRIVEVVELLRVCDCSANATHSGTGNTVTFAAHVTPPQLPRPRAAFSVLAAALTLLDPHIRAKSDSFTSFVRDAEKGTTTFTLITDVDRPTIQPQVYALESYLQHYGVDARVVIAEIRRRPPFTRYAQTRITVTLPTDENDAIEYNRAAAEFQEIA